MPPDTPLLVEAALAFMGVALLAIIGIGWGTRELVQKIHADATNPRSGFAAIWEAIDGLRHDFTHMERERRASPPVDLHG